MNCFDKDAQEFPYVVLKREMHKTIGSSKFYNSYSTKEAAETAAETGALCSETGVEFDYMVLTINKVYRKVTNPVLVINIKK